MLGPDDPSHQHKRATSIYCSPTCSVFRSVVVVLERVGCGAAAGRATRRRRRWLARRPQAERLHATHQVANRDHQVLLTRIPQKGRKKVSGPAVLLTDLAARRTRTAASFCASTGVSCSRFLSSRAIRGFRSWCRSVGGYFSSSGAAYTMPRHGRWRRQPQGCKHRSSSGGTCEHTGLGIVNRLDALVLLTTAIRPHNI